MTRRAETVLLVEGQGLVRKLTRQMLENVGYEVIEASTGEEAVALVEKHGAYVDLLLTDALMPKLGGPALAVRLMSGCADLRVVFMSGHREAAIINESTVPPGMSFLHKPFSSDELASTLRRALAVRKSDTIADAGFAVVPARMRAAGRTQNH